MSDKLYSGRKGSKLVKSNNARSKISNRRPPNRHSFEGDSEYVSTSSKKLKSSESQYDREVNDNFSYRLIEFISVFSALSQLVVCKQCKEEVRFSEASRRGLGFKIILTCATCGEFSINSCPLINGHTYEINTRFTLAMRYLGIGLNGMRKFCAFLELPRPVFQATYDKIVQNISIATESVRNLSIKKAAEEEKQFSVEHGQTNGLTVSGDGSWRKRGFSSLFGLVSLIGWFSKKVLDVSVKSKYCKACEHWKKKEGTAEYEEWAEAHKSACHANHEGSSGKMEVDSVVAMFKRSETLHNIKYACYVGDGDSKTYKGIVDAHPYDNFTVVKKECIDHVQKRMGTRLRNLKKKTKGLSGRGKLTGKLIDDLSIYYGLAIRRNHDSIEKMKNDIWATLYHKLSTDENPQHDKCPFGLESWCSWQRAKASGTLDVYYHEPAMHMDVFNAIKPIYEELSSDDLLSRCLGGFTQNSNESFNSAVWTIAPKASASGKIILDVAVDIAVMTYNDGLSSIMGVMDCLGLVVGRNLYDFAMEADSCRIKSAERSMSDAAKATRRDSRSSRKEMDEVNMSSEGQLYGPGIAD